MTTEKQTDEKPWIEIIVRVNPDFVPADGDAFDAVVAALEYFDIPTTVTLKAGLTLTEQVKPKG